MEEEMWYEQDGSEPVLVDIRKLDDDILALVVLQAAGERGYDNYFDPSEHSAIMGLAWARGLLSLNEPEIDRLLREQGVS